MDQEITLICHLFLLYSGNLQSIVIAIQGRYKHFVWVGWCYSFPALKKVVEKHSSTLHSTGNQFNFLEWGGLRGLSSDQERIQ